MLADKFQKPAGETWQWISQSSSKLANETRRWVFPKSEIRFPVEIFGDFGKLLVIILFGD